MKLPELRVKQRMKNRALESKSFTTARVFASSYFHPRAANASSSLENWRVNDDLSTTTWHVVDYM